ncbi:GNAT family N-acetyltransferase [Streptomyces boncukensis]|uniref:N-acetyltransferase n=1 Tax=Streptomyces boncukensis TaxID=2711219 RepID=A0A6G4X7C4_9ACTN|nr:GNAT family N-acetyltransferase [Streptomyces boncukensis]NGO72654.1 N-acetyltransferase [Streptomyces boncukensis]
MASLRAATPDDLKAVAEIYAHYVTHTVITFDEEPPDVPAWRDKHAGITAHGLPFLVSCAPGGEITGYAYAAPWRPKPAYRHTVEDTVYLAPEWTGRGTGSALLTALVEESARAGARQMIAVISDTGSESSPALHRRHGFRETGRLSAVGHKHDQWVDTLLMQRALVP